MSWDFSRYRDMTAGGFLRIGFGMQNKMRHFFSLFFFRAGRHKISGGLFTGIGVGVNGMVIFLSVSFSARCGRHGFLGLSPPPLSFITG